MLAASPGIATAFEPSQTFRKGAYVLSVEGGGGAENDIDSTFTFLIHAGVGASFFVTDTVALFLGYRRQHVSNGNTSQPNHGFESHTGVAGAPVFFP